MDKEIASYSDAARHLFLGIHNLRMEIVRAFVFVCLLCFSPAFALVTPFSFSPSFAYLALSVYVPITCLTACGGDFVCVVCVGRPQRNGGRVFVGGWWISVDMCLAFTVSIVSSPPP